MSAKKFRVYYRRSDIERWVARTFAVMGVLFVVNVIGGLFFR